MSLGKHPSWQTQADYSWPEKDVDSFSRFSVLAHVVALTPAGIFLIQRREHSDVVSWAGRGLDEAARVKLAKTQTSNLTF